MGAVGGAVQLLLIGIDEAEVFHVALQFLGGGYWIVERDDAVSTMAEKTASKPTNGQARTTAAPRR
jgi:hypothetical protein